MADTKFVDILAKSTVCGAVGAIVAGADNKFVFGDVIGNGGVNLYGKRVSFPMAMGIVLFVANLLSEFASSYILPGIHVSERLTSMLSSATAIGITFASSFIILNQSNPGLLKYMGLFNLLLVSAVVEASGSYLYSNWVHPLMIQS